jgi:membrane complex biogenesis BtpA family protein
MIKTRLLRDLFGVEKPVVGCIHLLPLPGSPLYDGKMKDVYETAERETEILLKQGVHGLIVENFRDKPFFPARIPPETVASLAAVGREIVRKVRVPVGVNALRSDGESALAIATAIGGHFVRVNVHMNAVVSEQGIIQGSSHNTLRLRSALKSKTLIFADVGVKHAAPLADRGLAIETRDLAERGLVDAIIVSGEMTGQETNPSDVEVVRQHTELPLLIGSGVTPENIHRLYDKADGFIVGSYFKKDGKGDNFVEARRVKRFMERIRKLAG